MLGKIFVMFIVHVILKKEEGHLVSHFNTHGACRYHVVLDIISPE